MEIPLLRLIMGGLLLFFGHRLFWLFAALAGFLFGVQFAASFGADWSLSIQLMLGAGLGILAAVLAVLSVKIAGAVVGFLVGWLLVGEIIVVLGFEAGAFNLILAVLGGIIGAGMVLAVFDFALMLLSALGGAAIIINTLGAAMDAPTGGVALLAIGSMLAIVGMVFQLRSENRRH